MTTAFDPPDVVVDVLAARSAERAARLASAHTTRPVALRPLPAVDAGPASRAFAQRVTAAVDDTCWPCRGTGRLIQGRWQCQACDGTGRRR